MTARSAALKMLNALSAMIPTATAQAGTFNRTGSAMAQASARRFALCSWSRPHPALQQVCHRHSLTAAAAAKRSSTPAPLAPVVENIEEKELHQEAQEAYLSYAMSVIVGRALPDVRDGLKPVHRRILYAMRSLGLVHSKPYKKCARVVGEVLGKYHPHGDTAVYDALVRLAQDFSMEVPLISGHGNFGSLDDDPPAAMRYTECRLAPAAEDLLLGDLDQDTVDWADNFDASEREPLVLPAKVPHLLVNGAQGIAVGIATKIPPHNLRELVEGLHALIDNPDITDMELMQYIPAPDFPTGGVILADPASSSIYTTGNGAVTLRAKVDIEYEGSSSSKAGSKQRKASTTTKKAAAAADGAQDAAIAAEEAGNGRALIVVTEVPYQTNKAALAAKIAELVEAKTLDGVADVRDESDRSGVRLVVEVKRGTSPQLVLAQLYKHTRLQQRFSANMVALVNGVPQSLTLRQFLVNFLEFRVTVVERRARHQLGQAQERLHLVEGFLTALAHLDGVVQTIRAAADSAAAREQLQQSYQLSERQAEGVLSLTLRRLTAMEADKLKQEQAQLQGTIADLQALLSDRKKVLNIVKEEAAAVAQKHGQPRRSIIQASQPEGEELSGLALIPNTPSLISFTQRGYIKRVPSSTYSTQRRGGKGQSGGKLREADALEEVVAAMAHDTLLLLAGDGRCYTLPAYKVPESSRTAAGTAVVQLLGLPKPIELKALMAISGFAQDTSLLLATRLGAIKRLPLSAFGRSKRKDGLLAIKLAPGDEICAASLCKDGSSCLLASSAGRVLHMMTDALKERGRTAGAIRGMKLGAGQTLVSMITLPPGTVPQPAAGSNEAPQEQQQQQQEDEPDQEEEQQQAAGPWVLFVTARGKGKRVPVSAFTVHGRGGLGMMGIKLSAGDKLCAAVGVSQPDDQLLVASRTGLVTKCSVQEVSSMGRTAQGLKLMKPGADDEVQTVTVVPEHHDADYAA